MRWRYWRKSMGSEVREIAWNKITCRQCGKNFSSTSPRAKLCGPCKRANKRASYRKCAGVSWRKSVVKRVAPKKDEKAAALLNERQRRLDAALDARMYAECSTSPAKVIRPGDPEFDAIAREVTPIERVPDRYHPLPPSQRHYLENGGFNIR